MCVNSPFSVGVTRQIRLPFAPTLKGVFLKLHFKFL